jgi:CheY-like chemotaxis protein
MEKLEILLIDDELGCKEHFFSADFLNEFSFEDIEYKLCSARVDNGYSPDEAAEFVRQNKNADLILLDWHFGAYSYMGAEILPKIAEYNIPTIVISSASGDTEVREVCDKYGINVFLPKDTFTKEEFYTEVKKLTGDKK